jgi:hypothetical protein
VLPSGPRSRRRRHEGRAADVAANLSASDATSACGFGRLSDGSQKGAQMTDEEALTRLNERFIEAFRQGSWELLRPILSSGFSYLDGATGEVWTRERYVDNLQGNPSSSLAIDQVAIHVDGDTAVLSARTSRQPGRYSRYVDTYERRGETWRCVHACVWPLSG